MDMFSCPNDMRNANRICKSLISGHLSSVFSQFSVHGGDLLLLHGEDDAQDQCVAEEKDRCETDDRVAASFQQAAMKRQINRQSV